MRGKDKHTKRQVKSSDYKERMSFSKEFSELFAGLMPE